MGQKNGDIKLILYPISIWHYIRWHYNNRYALYLLYFLHRSNILIGVQGVPSARAPGLGWLGFLVFHCQPYSAWADGNLAEAAERPNQSHTYPGARADGTPCNSLHFLQVCPRRRGLRWPGRGEQLGQQIVGREGKLAVQLWYCVLHSCGYFIWKDLV